MATFFLRWCPFGKVYQEATTLHNVPFSPNVVKVMVEQVLVVDAHVPLP